MPDYIKFPLVLLIVTLVSGTALAYIFRIAKPEIERREKQKTEEARRIVFPEAERFEQIEGTPILKAMKGTSLLGYIAGGGAEGYSSTVKVLVGVKRDLSVNGVTVLSQQETPGLGTRIEEVKSDKTWLLILTGQKSSGDEEGGEEALPWFLEQYKGLSLDEISIDAGKVDAITGATVSSRAVTESVHGAVAKVKEQLQAKKTEGAEEAK